MDNRATLMSRPIPPRPTSRGVAPSGRLAGRSQPLPAPRPAVAVSNQFSLLRMDPYKDILSDEHRDEVDADNNDLPSADQEDGLAGRYASKEVREPRPLPTLSSPAPSLPTPSSPPLLILSCPLSTILLLPRHCRSL
jgi:hypothetical protein